MSFSEKWFGSPKTGKNTRFAVQLNGKTVKTFPQRSKAEEYRKELNRTSGKKHTLKQEYT